MMEKQQRLIDANALVRMLVSVKKDYAEEGNDFNEKVVDFLIKIFQEETICPTIDAVPVRRGEWVGGELGHCTCCWHEGCASDIWNGVHGDGFCPNCGAKMGGAEDD